MAERVEKKCQLCGCPVRIIRRVDGTADHYEALTPHDLQRVENPIPPTLDAFLRASRIGKKTVAIVGGAWTTRGWAPFGDPDVEAWCFNEEHGQGGIGKATRWFQIHHKWSWSLNERFGHKDWLRQDRDYPIYMQRAYDDVPGSIPLPLKEIQDKLLTRAWRGEERLKKAFGCTFAYAIALAILEGFERIELFGIELVMDGEWAYQRESMSFWAGVCEGRGIELWMPEQCELLKVPLYGYEESRNGQGEVILPPDGYKE